MREHRAKVFMELMMSKPHTAYRYEKLEELKLIDAVMIKQKEYHESLVEAGKYGYFIKK